MKRSEREIGRMANMKLSPSSAVPLSQHIDAFQQPGKLTHGLYLEFLWEFHYADMIH